jgi:opacity protein-like surface antigen
MKKLCFLGMLLIVWAATCLAEGVKPVFYGSGGLSLPMKPSKFDDLAPLKIGVKDMYKTGVDFGGGVGVQVNPMVEIIGRVNYGSFQFDDKGLNDKFVEELERYLGVRFSDYPGLDVTVESDGGNLKVLEFMGDVKFLIPLGGEGAAFHPYLLGGIGITDVKITDADMAVTVSYMGTDTTFTGAIIGDSETKFAFNFGAGFEWMVSPTVGIFVEGRYAQVALTGEPFGYLPLRGGVKVMLGH